MIAFGPHTRVATFILARRKSAGTARGNLAHSFWMRQILRTVPMTKNAVAGSPWQAPFIFPDKSTQPCYRY